MHHCLALAERGRGSVGNGAMVGAVLVRDGAIIAEGFHAGFGMSHAERDMLERFDDAIHPTDTLYVNLEPCCHHGKTPPCTDIILERGVQHVVYGMEDPDERMRGEGIEKLIKNGVHVFGPVLGPECERFNRGFVSLRTKNRPFITLKSARTRSGRIAHADGAPLAITSEEQNRWSHTFLRAQHDAILVGVGTVLADDPVLDARLARPRPRPHPQPLSLHAPPACRERGAISAAQDVHEQTYAPLRIILDPHLRIPLTARVVSDDQPERTMIIHAPIVTREQEDTVAELAKRGVMLREVPLQEDTFDWPLLWQALTAPDGNFHGITSILVEGGQKTWAAFREAGMVDEEVGLVGAV